jgi:cyanophycinase
MSYLILSLILVTGWIPSLKQETSRYESIGISGSPKDVNTKTEAGFVLAGGSTDVDEAFRWMIKRSGGGDFCRDQGLGRNRLQ